MKAHFLSMAHHNAWARLRLHRMAAALTDEQYRQSTPLYSRSLHGTLNYMLSTDQIWLRILTTAVGNNLDRAGVILFDDRPSLAAARIDEDAKIIAYLESLGEPDSHKTLQYQIEGNPQAQTRRALLAHLFNHETHHRGQAHAILTLAGVAEPNSLDLFTMHLEWGVAVS